MMRDTNRYHRRGKWHVNTASILCSHCIRYADGGPTPQHHGRNHTPQSKDYALAACTNCNEKCVVAYRYALAQAMAGMINRKIPCPHGDEVASVVLGYGGVQPIAILKRDLVPPGGRRESVTFTVTPSDGWNPGKYNLGVFDSEDGNEICALSAYPDEHVDPMNRTAKQIVTLIQMNMREMLGAHLLTGGDEEAPPRDKNKKFAEAHGRTDLKPLFQDLVTPDPPTAPCGCPGIDTGTPHEVYCPKFSSRSFL